MKTGMLGLFVGVLFAGNVFARGVDRKLDVREQADAEAGEIATTAAGVEYCISVDGKATLLPSDQDGGGGGGGSGHGCYQEKQ